MTRIRADKSLGRAKLKFLRPFGRLIAPNRKMYIAPACLIRGHPRYPRFFFSSAKS